MWHCPRPGIEPCPLRWQVDSSTTGPLGKSPLHTVDEGPGPALAPLPFFGEVRRKRTRPHPILSTLPVPLLQVVKLKQTEHTLNEKRIPCRRSTFRSLSNSEFSFKVGFQWRADRGRCQAVQPLGSQSWGRADHHQWVSAVGAGRANQPGALIAPSSTGPASL